MLPRTVSLEYRKMSMTGVVSNAFIRKWIVYSNTCRLLFTIIVFLICLFFFHQCDTCLKCGLINLHHISFEIRDWFEPIDLIIHVHISEMLLYIYRAEASVITQVTLNAHSQMFASDVGAALSELGCRIRKTSIHALIDGLPFGASSL